jgi:hypothetical protein
MQMDMGYIHLILTSKVFWIYCKSTLLLVMNLKPYVKVVKKLKTPPFSHGL